MILENEGNIARGLYYAFKVNERYYEIFINPASKEIRTVKDQGEYNGVRGVITYGNDIIIWSDDILHSYIEKTLPEIKEKTAVNFVFSHNREWIVDLRRKYTTISKAIFLMDIHSDLLSRISPMDKISFLFQNGKNMLDTKTREIKSEVRNLRDDLRKINEFYNKPTKYMAYQKIFYRLREDFNIIEQGVRIDRYERERMDFIKRYLDLQDKTILDIGGNLGFFSLESLCCDAKEVSLYEGFSEYCEIANLTSRLIGVDDRLKIRNQFFEFDRLDRNYDICFLLNVMHHLGMDFCKDSAFSIEDFKRDILDKISRLAENIGTLVFQIGWVSRYREIFETRDASQVIEFLSKGLKGSWEISKIGIPQKINSGTIYEDLTLQSRQLDTAEEFLLRPLFILKSVKYPIFS